MNDKENGNIEGLLFRICVGSGVDNQISTWTMKWQPQLISVCRIIGFNLLVVSREWRDPIKSRTKWQFPVSIVFSIPSFPPTMRKSGRFQEE